MKFGDFNKLACGDRVTLVSAIDILMQVGQNYVREAQPSEVASEIKKAAEISSAAICLRRSPKPSKSWPS